MLTQSKNRLANCPEQSALKDYLLGKLSDEFLDQFERHFSDCQTCEETLRGLDANDTFSKLVNSASDSSDELDEHDKQFVGNLITQMKSEDRFHRLGSEIAEKAAEVTCLLTAVDDDSDAIGTFGDYQVESLIGAGSTGVVFRAVDRKLNRLVALKVLRPSLGRAARERFMAEARLAAAIEHQNVVTIYQVGEEEVGGVHPIAFIAMQWIAGETLEDRFKKVAFLPENEVKEIASQIALGLSAAHQKNLIHRDIKPANIWLCEESNRVIILDFGLARIADDDPHMTNTGMLAGTPNFMSPEQTRGQELDGRSDLFSLGCLMYRTATGKLPFGSSGVLATLQSIQTYTPNPPAMLNPHISDDFSDLVMCLLEKQTANRPENAAQLIDAIKLPRTKWDFIAAHHQKVEIKTKSRPQSSSGLTAWISVAILFGLIASFGYMFAPDIIRIATNQGELIIDCKDKDIKIEVLSGGEVIKVIDTRTAQTINIKAGDYSFQVQDSRNGFSVSPSKLTMTRGGKEVLTISSGESKYKNSEIAALTEKLNRSFSRSMKEGSPELIKKLKKEVAQAEKIVEDDSPRLNASESSMNDLEKIDELKKVINRIRNNQFSPLNTKLIETQKEGNRTFRESKNAEAKRYSPRIVSANNATYGGKTFSEWASILKTERDGSTINQGLKAIAQLSRNENNLQEVAIDAIRPIVRKHGGLETDKAGHVDAITEFFNFIPSNLVLDFVVEEIRSGTVQSHRQLFWLLSPNNMIEYVSNEPELATARQKIHLRNLKSRFPEISKACDDAMKTAGSESKKNLVLVQQWATRFSNSTLDQLNSPFGSAGGNVQGATGVVSTTKNIPTYDGRAFNEWIAILSTERNHKTVNSAIVAISALSQDDPNLQNTAINAIRPIVRKYGSIVIDDYNRVNSINRFFNSIPSKMIFDFVIEEIKSGTPQSQTQLFWLLSPENMVQHLQPNGAKISARMEEHRTNIRTRLLDICKASIDAMEKSDSERKIYVATALHWSIDFAMNDQSKRRSGMGGGMFNQVNPIRQETKLDPKVVKYLTDRMQSTKDAETATYIAIELILNDAAKQLATAQIQKGFFDENMPKWIPVLIYHKVLLNKPSGEWVSLITKLFYKDSIVEGLTDGNQDQRLRGALLNFNHWQATPQTPDSIRIRLIQCLGNLGQDASAAKEWLTEQSTLQVPWAGEAKKALLQIETDGKAKKKAPIQTPTFEKAKTETPPVISNANKTPVSGATENATPTYDGKTYEQWRAILNKEKSPVIIRAGIVALGELTREKPELIEPSLEIISQLMEQYGEYWRNSGATNFSSEFAQFFSAVPPERAIQFFLTQFPNGNPKIQKQLYWVLIPSMVYRQSILENRENCDAKRNEYRDQIESKMLEITKMILSNLNAEEADHRHALLSMLDSVIIGPSIQTGENNRIHVKHLRIPPVNNSLVALLLSEIRTTKFADIKLAIALTLTRWGASEDLTVQVIVDALNNPSLSTGDYLAILQTCSKVDKKNQSRLVVSLLNIRASSKIKTELYHRYQRSPGKDSKRTGVPFGAARTDLIQVIGSFGSRATPALDRLDSISKSESPEGKFAKQVATEIRQQVVLARGTEKRGTVELSDEIVAKLTSEKNAKFVKLKISFSIQQSQAVFLSQRLNATKKTLLKELAALLEKETVLSLRGKSGQNELREKILKVCNRTLFKDEVVEIGDIHFSSFSLQ